MNNILSFGQKKAEKYDLTQYAIAKRVNQEFPIIIKSLDILLKLLYTKKQYRSVAIIIQVIEEQKQIMLAQLKQFQTILATKGKIHE